MASDWNGQQPAERGYFACLSKLKSNILNICYDVFLRNFMIFKAVLLQISFRIRVPKIVKIQCSLLFGPTVLLS